MPRNLGMNLAIMLEPQSITQNADDIAAQRHFSDHVQACFAMAGFQQTEERAVEVAIAEILELAAPFCFLDQFLRGKRPRAESNLVGHGPTFVQQTNRERRTTLFNRGADRHDINIVVVAFGKFKRQLCTACVVRAGARWFGMATEKATFGAGCFWGVEETFRNLKGVTSTAVGYAGGNKENPSYEDVCSDETGHAEVVQLEFDPSQISYDLLLDVFWSNHNPTTLNRQGPDVGTQYRSVIFYHSPEQKAAAEAAKQKLGASGKFNRPIITQIEPAPKFWRAEEYHQRYLEKRGQSHCAI